MENVEAELLPGGLITCLLDNNEVRILKISQDKIAIRVAEKLYNIKELKLCFYIFKKYKYNEIIIPYFDIVSEEKKEFSYTYVLKIQDNEYSQNVKNIFKDYSKYVTLKNYGIENEFSEDMVGYPAEKDFDFYEFYDDQKREWMKDLKYENFNPKLLDNIEMSVVINNDFLYKKYIENDINSFMKSYLEDNFVDGHKLFEKEISRIYVGNEFCHNLFPDLKMLLQIINKALKESLKITLCFTYMREDYIQEYKNILNKVYVWCKEKNEKIEIVFNDWGMLSIIKDKKDYFDFNLGILLNKRKKDPRYIYKKGCNENKKLMAQNSLNDKEFRGFLQKYNILRYEYESCGYKMEIPQGNHSLNMPFYITNTSQYCTLYAMCTSLDRGKQKLVKNCPKYCKDYIFSYPKHLKMVGRYNSLFAFDDTLLKNAQTLEYYINSGINRIVFDFI